MQDGATKGRARKTSKQRSLLCGKIFDETGDRLTPSHSKTKAGTRLRYYVSHRLIKHSGEASKDGWRLPAEELEQKVADVLRSHINRSSFIGRIAVDASASTIAIAKDKVQSVCARQSVKQLLELIERIELSPGELHVTISAEKLGVLLEQYLEDTTQAHLTIIAPFQLRKRGVETKLVFGDEPQGRDQTLIKNIAKAHAWYQQIKDGKTLSQIATADSTSNRRVQQMLDLAFLAPDIVRDVLNGSGPTGLTSDWTMRHALPADWSEQRVLLATL